MTEFDPVSKPKHYNSHPSGVEIIELTRELSFDLGNAVKYVMRHKHKGNPKQDLEKAVWYLGDHIDHFDSHEFNDYAVDTVEKIIDQENDATIILFLMYLSTGRIGKAVEVIQREIIKNYS